MKVTLSLIFLILVFTSCHNTNSETPSNEDSIITANNVDKLFPDDYLGIYKGDLNIITSAGNESIPMEFHLLSTADSTNYKYKIFYGTERSERAYNLKRTSNPNLFLVDENNGIVLETAYSNRTLYSTYEVMGNLLNCTEVFHDDYMEFMITMSRKKDTTQTGAPSSALVTNYPISVMQKAVLYKQPTSTLPVKP